MTDGMGLQGCGSSGANCMPRTAQPGGARHAVGKQGIARAGTVVGEGDDFSTDVQLLSAAAGRMMLQQRQNPLLPRRERRFVPFGMPGVRRRTREGKLDAPPRLSIRVLPPAIARI